MYYCLRCVKVGEYSAKTKYVRKRIDYNVFDEVGHGHQIHAASFSTSPFQRQSSVDSFPAFDGGDPDTVSITKSLLTIQRRPSLSKSSSVLSYRDGTLSRAGTRSTAMKFPAPPSSFPKAPTTGAPSFPAVLESPVSDAGSSITLNAAPLVS